ncbi:MAG: DUF2784 domain-containing protein [Nevskiales bacterium]
MYTFLDGFFVALHTGLVLFNLTGWIWKRTRRPHLAVISLTILSWFGLGAFFGWGYCPCTDWHWRIKRALGETGLPDSYIKYYLDRLTGIDWNPFVVDMATLVLGLTVLALSCALNWRDYRAGRRVSASIVE